MLAFTYLLSESFGRSFSMYWGFSGDFGDRTVELLHVSYCLNHITFFTVAKLDIPSPGARARGCPLPHPSLEEIIYYITTANQALDILHISSCTLYYILPPPTHSILPIPHCTIAPPNPAMCNTYPTLSSAASQCPGRATIIVVVPVSGTLKSSVTCGTAVEGRRGDTLPVVRTLVSLPGFALGTADGTPANAVPGAHAWHSMSCCHGTL